MWAVYYAYKITRSFESLLSFFLVLFVPPIHVTVVILCGIDRRSLGFCASFHHSA